MATRKSNQPSYMKYKGMTPRQAGIKYETSSEQDATIGKWLAANDPKGTKYKTAQAYIDSNGRLTTKRAMDEKNFKAGKTVNGINNSYKSFAQTQKYGIPFQWSSTQATGWKSGGGHKREFLLDVGRASRRNIVANDQYLDKYGAIHKDSPWKEKTMREVIGGSKYGARKSVNETLYRFDDDFGMPAIDKNSRLGRKMTEFNNKRPTQYGPDREGNPRAYKDDVYTHFKHPHRKANDLRYSKGTTKYNNGQGLWKKPTK